MKAHSILSIPLLATLLFTACNTPKSDGTAKHDGATTIPAAQKMPADQASSETQATAGAIHVTDILDVETNSTPNMKAAPNFTWKTSDGQVRSLKDYSGKVVLINFWGTWCPPCRAELPDIVKLRNELQSKGFEVIGLGVGEQSRMGKTPAEWVADFAQKNSLNYPLLLADERVAQAYGGIEAVPTTFIVNGKGDIVDKLVGMQTEAKFRAAIMKAM
jgi:cytochrome c biogenesis protein CcmG/thiol:disulfide interchange protein DsbE